MGKNNRRPRLVWLSALFVVYSVSFVYENILNAKQVGEIAQLLQLNPSLLSIMITVHEDDDHIYSALRNGAVGYLNKNTNPQVLIESIKIAVDGGSPMSPNIARKVIQNFQQDKKVVQLTEQELIILEALAEGLSYKMVAKKIFLSVDGVRYHIRNIYSKLDAKNRADAISKAYVKNIFRRSE